MILKKKNVIVEFDTKSNIDITLSKYCPLDH